MTGPKWCSHCRKTDHNDSECWSTRMVPPVPDYEVTVNSAVPPFNCAPMSDELRLALLRACAKNEDIS